MLSVFWFAALGAVSVAQIAKEMDDQMAFKSVFGVTEASCDALVIAEFDSQELLGEGKPRIIAFDKSKCMKKLEDTQFSAYLQPLFSYMAMPDAQQPLTGEERAKETTADREQRIKTDSEQVRLMQSELQKNIKPLVSLCRELGIKYSGEHSRICYFGGPNAKAGFPFRSLFQAMIDHTQPADETLCANEPIKRGLETVPEFSNFLAPNENSLSWAEVQQSLLRDKFDCRGEGDFGGCSKIVMALLVSAHHEKVEGVINETLGPEDGAAIIPRMLTAYHGNWRSIGPYSSCTLETEGKGDKDCSHPMPERGTKEGVCSANEDWHVWGHIMYLLNRSNENE